jgi:hypothetical protein
VRRGADEWLPPDKEGNPQHTMVVVHTEMFLQICADYHCLPDPRSLTAREIRFYYAGIRADLKAHTKPKG